MTPECETAKRSSASIERMLALSFLVTVSLGCGSDNATLINSGPESQTATSVDRPPAADDAVEIVRAAIDAHGGEANFARANVGQTTMEIEGAFQPGLSGRFTKIDRFELPAKLKRVVDGQAQGENVSLIFVCDGQAAWIQRNSDEPTESVVADSNQRVYPADNLEFLVGLLGPDFSLSVEPAEPVGGQPAHRIRMESNSEWIGDAYFDKETHLLVASKKELFDPQIQKTRKVETYYSAFKTVDGLNLPMSIKSLIDGQNHMRITITEVTFLPDIADEEFAKPIAR